MAALDVMEAHVVFLRGFCLLLGVAAILQSQTAVRETSPESVPGGSSGLPVKRVVLYKSGVGYFEHLGRVRGNQDVPVSFTSGQLDDVLKSLTAIDLDGGRISGITYNSGGPAERQLGDLRLPAGDKSTLTEFLAALRGSRLEVRTGASAFSGRLLSVERKTRTGAGATLEVDYVSLLTDSGEIRTAELSPSFTFRLLERGLSGKVERFLDLIASRRESEVRRMIVSTAGSGERSLFVSYVSEVPLWKSTYRIVLNSKAGQRPLLQGWAIVDNTTGQDWTNVQLSLVAGAPQSFIQNLSQPYYSRRAVVPMPENVTFAPQTHESTLIPGGARLSGAVTDPAGIAVAGARVSAFDAGGRLLAATSTSPAGTYEFPGLPEGSARLEVELPGFRKSVVQGILLSDGQPARINVRLEIGAAGETVEVTAAPSPLMASTGFRADSPGAGRALGSGAGLGSRRPPEAPALPPPAPKPADISMARTRAVAAASGQELGDLFEYKLKEPVTIQKNRSALVPIVQSPIALEKVSLWNEQSGLPKPQRALWLTNSSGLTLDGGTFSVIEEEAFAGEGIMEPLRPAEKRLVTYALDLALNVSSKNATEQQRITRVRISRGVLTHSSELRERKTYTARNEDTSPRTLIIEHPVRPAYKLSNAVKPAESSATWMRFRVQVESKQTASLVVEESRPMENAYMLTNISPSQIALFVRQQSINKPIEDALRRIIDQKAAIGALEEEKKAREEETQRIFDDQQRVRENMKSLKGSAEEKALLQRYTQQLNQQEDRLATLRKEVQEVETKRENAQAALDRLVDGLSFEVTL